MRSGIRAGWFYVVQLLPDVTPNRLKFGFAQQLHERSLNYKITCPHSTILVSYPSLSSDEHLAIATIVGPSDIRLTSEMYDVVNIESTLQRLASFFEWTTWIDEDFYERMVKKSYTRALLADYLADIRDPESELRQNIHSESHGLRAIRIA